MLARAVKRSSAEAPVSIVAVPSKTPFSKPSDASTVRSLNDAENMSNNNMLRHCQDHALLPEHLNIQKRLREFREQRDTLLCSRQYRNSDEYRERVGLFPSVYGRTAEAMVSEGV